jgi:peroxiredoxin
MKLKIRNVVLGILLLTLTGTLSGQKVGQKAPLFTYYDANGNKYSLSAYRGKVVFLFTFGNDCDICHATGNDTETKVQKVFGDRDDFQALGLDTWDYSSNAATLGAFAQRTGISFPLLMKAGSFEKLYSTTWDRVIVVDQEGVIRHKNNLDTKDDLKNAIAVIESLLLSTGNYGIEGEIVEGIQVFPNPASDLARVTFHLESEDRVKIRIYNAVGKETKTILDSHLPAGDHTKEFSLEGLSPGLYIVKMERTGRSFSRKILVNR